MKTRPELDASRLVWRCAPVPARAKAISTGGDRLSLHAPGHLCSSSPKTERSHPVSGGDNHQCGHSDPEHRVQFSFCKHRGRTQQRVGSVGSGAPRWRQELERVNGLAVRACESCPHGQQPMLDSASPPNLPSQISVLAAHELSSGRIPD